MNTKYFFRLANKDSIVIETKCIRERIIVGYIHEVQSENPIFNLTVPLNVNGVQTILIMLTQFKKGI